MKNTATVSADAIEGCLLGLMLGDTLGLPYEGLSARRVSKWLTPPLHQALLWRYGMVSDDTEHALMTALAAATYPHDADAFQRNLGWRLRWWLARLPAGIGMATGRSIIKLWLGVPARYAGVFSAGNGAAMRAPILGVLFGAEPEKLKAYVRASTLLSHRDPKAYLGALAVAWLAWHHSVGLTPSAKQFAESLTRLLNDVGAPEREEFVGLLEQVVYHAEHNDMAGLIAELKLDKGVTGYVYHTVPVVLCLALMPTAPLLEKLQQLILLGGDTDTTAAILGGILGAGQRDWQPCQLALTRIRDWPLSATSVRRSAQRVHQRLEDGRTHLPLTLGPLVLLRNLAFLALVLAHGFRRLLPPW